ncbi:MAG: GFA family protein [Hyphomicrobiaceae bacterium]|nr:GFA family protein [Hyphomicrobiaceae bacterium]
MSSLTGRCACGGIRYELASEPMFTHCCHCLDCQRQTGSAFVINGLIETDRIRLTVGEVIETSFPTESGKPHLVYRCGDCLTVLWSDYGARGYLSFLRAGTLDDPSQIRPDVHIFTRTKLPWVQLPPDVPAFEVFYDMKSLWPEAALDRRRTASAAAKSSRT